MRAIDNIVEKMRWSVISKLSKIMVLMFFIGMLIDFGITYAVFIIEGHSMSETNPLFIMLGGNHLMFWLCILILSVFYYIVIVWPMSPQHRFLILTFVVLASLTRLVAIIGNIGHIIHPVTETVAVGLSNEAKVSYYTAFVSLFLLVPFVVQWIIFRLFLIEYEVINKPRGE